MTGKARLSQDYAYHNDAIIPAGAFLFPVEDAGAARQLFQRA